ncbi:M48 metallopeptidase family protein [Brumimicrobium glaciale]|uniref:M48 metallopeptidase family protein n=1 Tax=Brumimicrobium glaciale TaxID=200475 RepID=UPI001F5C9ECC|nr:M48 family metallopeptidase [Brumimicrobium glaciale]
MIGNHQGLNTDGWTNVGEVVIKNGGIHLNLELIKAPKKCIEYVLVHELCHLVHHDHSKAFYELLEKLYPDWRKTKIRLEKLMV